MPPVSKRTTERGNRPPNRFRKRKRGSPASVLWLPKATQGRPPTIPAIARNHRTSTPERANARANRLRTALERLRPFRMVASAFSPQKALKGLFEASLKLSTVFPPCEIVQTDPVEVRKRDKVSHGHFSFSAFVKLILLLCDPENSRNHVLTFFEVCANNS